MYVTLSRQTTLHMMEMKASWKDLLKQQISFGEDFRSCRKKNVSIMACWNVRQRLFQA